MLAIAGGVDLKHQEDAKQNVEMKIAVQKLQLTTISSIQVQYSQLMKSSVSVATALINIRDEWISLSSGIREVISELTNLIEQESADYLSPLLEEIGKLCSLRQRTFQKKSRMLFLLLKYLAVTTRQ